MAVPRDDGEQGTVNTRINVPQCRPKTEQAEACLILAKLVQSRLPCVDFLTELLTEIESLD